MARRGSFDWNAAAIERLKTLWTEGYSASEVGAFLGVSRNSVIGKLHRLGLTGMQRRRTRPKGSSAPRLVAPPPRVRKPKPIAPLLTSIEQVSKEPVIGSFTLMDLKFGSCRWPSDGDGPWTFCGAPQEFGSSYCLEHHRRGTQGLPGRTGGVFRFGREAA